MFAGRAIFRQSCSELLVAWVLRLSWAIACAYPFPAFSEPVPVWVTFTPENSDLPHTDILALAFGEDGTLWMGTHGGGLARFDKDGRWKTYSTVNTNGGLPYDLVLALAPGADDALWVGTERGLARLDKDGRWQTYSSANTKGGLPDDDILALARGADGALWIGTTGGLARRDKDGHWQNYTTASTKGGLPNDNVHRLALDADGALWVGTMRGVARLDRGGRWQSYSTASTKGGLPSDQVKALAITTDGALWVGTFGGGLARRDRDGHWQAYSKASTKGGLPNDTVWTLTPGPDSTLWVGTYGGVVRRDKDGRWQTYSMANTNGGLQSDRIWSLAPSADGALWIGTWGGGLTRVDLDRDWQTFTSANTKGGLPSDDVKALTVGADGGLWFGTFGGGLAKRGKDGQWQTYSKANTKGGVPDDRVLALASGADGALWLGTGGGLTRLDQDRRWTTYSTANTKGQLPSDIVVALAPGPGGALWIGTAYGGLARLDTEGNWRTYQMPNAKLPIDLIQALVVGADGALWIGTKDRGLARLDKDGHWQTYSTANTNGGLPGDAVTALAIGEDESLWIGVFHIGLARLDKGGRWQHYTTASTNGGLPFEIIQTVAPGAGGTVWIGTEQGLARLDKGAHWQTYTTANTSGGLPNDIVEALAPGADGALWIGTHGGLGYFRPAPTPTHRIVESIGASDQVNRVAQGVQTVSVVAFDSSYRTEPWLFRYAWRMIEPVNEAVPEITRSAVYRATFEHDGTYVLRVNAIDRNGEWSEPRDIKFKVDLPKTDSTQETLWRAGKALLSSGAIYFALLFPLIPLYPRFSWARTAINSGMFTKFPLLHKTILNTHWARGYLFRQLAAKASGTELPKPYIPQSLFAAADKAAKPVLHGSRGGLTLFFATQHRVLLVARSGTGKSVFLRHLQREVAARFQSGEGVPAPVLIDLRTHVLSGRKVQDLVRDALHGAGVELADGDLDFLIGKGGFLILVDSLNELPDPADARLFHTFFNQDADNLVLVASQVDLIRRQDTPLFNLAEVTPEQAASFLAEAVGRDVYSELPQEAQALARNPQDLALLAEVVEDLGTARVPTHRAELYREILKKDGALMPRVGFGDPHLAAIYNLAFRMVSERRVLQDDQLREWIAADPAVSTDDVAKVMQAVQASRLFRPEVVRDVLGKAQPVTGFRHELIGKFLAARHVRRMIGQGADSATVDYISLSGDELWLDMFYFVIDEIDSSLVLNRFLKEILAAGGPTRERITAYANKTRGAEVESEVLDSYKEAKLAKDLALTPAA